MKGRWRHPMKSMGWYRDVKQTFADLPGTRSLPSDGGHQ